MHPLSRNTAPGLFWIGGYEEATGLADELRGFLRVLEASGQEPAVRRFYKPRHTVELSASDRRMLEVQSRREARMPGIAVHHYIPTVRQLSAEGVLNVARSMFETDNLPTGWRDLLLQRDEIWVPCEHNAEAFRRGGIPASKLRVLGGTLDFEAFAPGAEPYPLEVDEERFVFLSNFDFGERKGWRQLIGAWAKAFSADDPVCLVLKTGSYEKGEDYAAERIRDFVRDKFGAGTLERMAPMDVLSTRLPGDRIPSLYAAADAYVLASRGEGWGRPYMEAMAMGLPTIASRWGGNLEFMHDGNSWLVDGTLVPVEAGVEAFPTHLTAGHRWFEPDVDSLVAALRAVASDPAAARARAAGARSELIERFGPDATVARITELASEAIERRSRPAFCAIRGSFGSNASLAVVNDGLADALERRGHNVVHRFQATEAPLLQEAPGISHSWPPSFDNPSAGPTVMILPWEFGSPPREWVDEVNRRVDRVWVPSAYVRDAYVEAGMPPGVVEVVPNGVDLERFRPDGPRYELPRVAGCTFLFVGGSIWRKGIDLLIAAWADAFGPDDDVQLVVKDFGTSSHYRGQTVGDDLCRLAEREGTAPVTYIDDDLSPDQVASLYRACDVLVTPYRGEGFCLPALEAMACGLPVVHTAIGPTSEFVPDDGGWAVPARRAPLREGARVAPLMGEGFVHQVDHDALVATLRAVAAAPEERRARAAAAHTRAQDYTWDRIAAIAEDSLARLAREDLPLAREVGAATLERRDRLALLAPDWECEESWAGPLLRWVSAVAPDDRVTLALHLPPGADPGALVGRILALLAAHGIAEHRLPDLALCEPGCTCIASLVSAADAVLLPDAGAAGPELTRRARLLLSSADEIEAFAAGLRRSGADEPLPPVPGSAVTAAG